MKRALILAIVLCAPGCAAIAGVDDYNAVDCVEGQCGLGADSGTEETAIADTGGPMVDSVVETSLVDTAMPPPDVPVCTPIAASSVAIGAWSIDATEVTNAQYAAFLAAKGTDMSGQIVACTFNVSYRPAAGWPAAPEKCNHPVVHVDWCDANAYCKWAGKRLCGNPTGGSASHPGFANITTSMWFAACSKAGTAKYIYGATHIPGTCVDDQFDGKGGVATTDFVRRVGEAANCRGVAPYDKLYDINGNVWEWEDSCNETKDGDDDCRIRGGSYLEAWDKTDCDENKNMKRKQASADVGFRCCSP